MSIPKWKQRQRRNKNTGITLTFTHDPKTAAEVESRRKRRLAIKKGDQAEGIILSRLKGWGLAVVRKIHTSQNKYGAYKKSVEGDIRAIKPGTGQAVLVEVKYRPDRLSYVDIELHQHAALQETVEAGAIALLAWVSSHGVAVMRYPVDGLQKGKRLTWEEAEAQALTSI